MFEEANSNEELKENIKIFDEDQEDEINADDENEPIKIEKIEL